MSDTKALSKNLREPNWVMLVRFGREAEPALQKWTIVLDEMEWSGLWRVEEVQHRTENTIWLRARCGNDINDILIHDAAGFQSGDGRIVVYRRKEFEVTTEMVAANYAKVARGHYDAGQLGSEPLYIAKPTLPGDTPVSEEELQKFAERFPRNLIENEVQFRADAPAPPVAAPLPEVEGPPSDYPAQQVGSVRLEGNGRGTFLYVDDRILVGWWRVVSRTVTAGGATLYAINESYDELCKLNARQPFMPSMLIYSAVHLFIPGPLTYQGEAADDRVVEVFCKR